VTEEPIDSTAKITIRKPHHNRWLMLIAAFKLSQALLFIATGVSVLRLIHHDLPDLVLRWARHMHFNPESHFVDFILDRVSIVDDKLLRRFGLYFEKAWAEYMTLLITASFLPWEVWEIFKRLTLVHASLLVVNFLVLLYLLKVVVERGKQQRGAEPPVE